MIQCRPELSVQALRLAGKIIGLSVRMLSSDGILAVFCFPDDRRRETVV